MVRKTAVAAGLLIAASSADAFSSAGRVSTPSLRSSVVSARPAARHMGGVTMQDSTPNRIGMAIPSAWVEKDQYSLGGPIKVGDLVIVNGQFGAVTKKTGLPWSSDWEVSISIDGATKTVVPAAQIGKPSAEAMEALNKPPPAPPLAGAGNFFSNLFGGGGGGGGASKPAPVAAAAGGTAINAKIPANWVQGKDYGPVTGTLKPGTVVIARRSDNSLRFAKVEKAVSPGIYDLTVQVNADGSSAFTKRESETRIFVQLAGAARPAPAAPAPKKAAAPPAKMAAAPAAKKAAAPPATASAPQDPPSNPFANLFGGTQKAEPPAPAPKAAAPPAKKAAAPLAPKKEEAPAPSNPFANLFGGAAAQQPPASKAPAPKAAAPPAKKAAAPPAPKKEETPAPSNPFAGLFGNAVQEAPASKAPEPKAAAPPAKKAAAAPPKEEVKKEASPPAGNPFGGFKLPDLSELGEQFAPKTEVDAKLPDLSDVGGKITEASKTLTRPKGEKKEEKKGEEKSGDKPQAGIDLPKVDLPKVDLPKVDLPKVDIDTAALDGASKAVEAGAKNFAVGFLDALSKGITTMENASDESAAPKAAPSGKPVEKPAASQDSKPASSGKAVEKPPASKLPMNLAKKNAVEANKKQWGIEEPLKA